MTIPDYQVIVNCIATLLCIGFPIFLIFELAMRFMNIILDFISGRRKIDL